MKPFFQKLKSRARFLKSETRALYFAFRDPRTPWYAKSLLFFVLAYVLSPIDLIPDFIPVIGYLDDFIVVSAGVALTFKMIPANVMSDARKTAIQNQAQFAIFSKIGMIAIILIWILAAAWIIWQLYLLLSKIKG